jgi:choline dehydrogenase-like flavoprotein
MHETQPLTVVCKAFSYGAPQYPVSAVSYSQRLPRPLSHSHMHDRLACPGLGRVAAERFPAARVLPQGGHVMPYTPSPTTDDIMSEEPPRRQGTHRRRKVVGTVYAGLTTCMHGKQMFQTLSQLDTSQALEFDLCIVGAGAAGITIANKLKDARIRICLLEGGGLDNSDESQSIYQGVSDGYMDLRSCRLRFFGGSTNHWTGYCRPPEDADLKKRNWEPLSGWPITMADIQPFLSEAIDIVGVQNKFDQASWAKEHGVTSLNLPTKDFREGLSLVGPPVRFKEKYKDEIEKSTAISCLLNTNLIEFLPTVAGDRVEQVAIKDHDGRSFKLKAKLFVLACGGIENARLLLNSNSRASKGIGNKYDLVGRFFADHCIRFAGLASLTRAGDKPLIYELGQIQEQQIRIHPHLQMEITLAEKLRLPRVIVRLQPERPTRITRLGEALESFWKGDNTQVSRSFRILTFVEPLPNSKNRITLLDECDKLGLRRAKLVYRPSELEVTTISETLKKFAAAVGAAGRGRVQINTAAINETPRAWAFHHYGTTRMHDDPKQGVVDGDCRVHGLTNLFVAGSSLFPTPGLMTPTMTIVALALRLANRLKVEINV